MYRYPAINLRSKCDFCKRVATKKLSRWRLREHVRKVSKCMGDYWVDYTTLCDEESGKFVRAAFKKGPLKAILFQIDKCLLVPFDSLLPGYIYGGLVGKSTKQAASSLLQCVSNFSMIRLDFRKFYEQITSERVFRFFYHKCGCKLKFARFAADVCCVNAGPKNAPLEEKCLARGFSPSTRLSVWCNLEFFFNLKRLVTKTLASKTNPRIMIWIDDIGITARNVTELEMKVLFEKIVVLAEKYGLEIHSGKSGVLNCADAKELLGLRLHKNSIAINATKSIRLDVLKDIDRLKLPQFRQYFEAKYNNLLKYKHRAVR